MRLFTTLISFIALLLPAIPAAPLEPRALQPAYDPFSSPPKGWESQQVGSILATRPAIPATLGLFPNLGLQGWQVLYRTQGALGEPLATVAAILKPLGAKKDRLLAYTFAEDGNNRKRAPSYNLQFLAVQENLIVTVESFLVYSALAQGLSVPVSMSPTLSNHHHMSNPKIAIWGYSGGGAASGWAAALQPSYAPELNLIGVAQGGTPANLTATAEFIDGGASAGCKFQF